MFLPLIAAVLLLFFVRAKGGESEQFLKWNKKNNDKRVEDFKVELKRAQKEIAEIEDEEERVRERIKNEEAYLLDMGDRQDLRINMTQMTDDEFEKCVIEHADRCSHALNLSLEKSNLIKTQVPQAGRG